MLPIPAKALPDQALQPVSVDRTRSMLACDRHAESPWPGEGVPFTGKNGEVGVTGRFRLLEDVTELRRAQQPGSLWEAPLRGLQSNR